MLSFFDSLLIYRDMKVFRQLAYATVAQDTITQACDRRDDVRGRVAVLDGSTKSALGAYLSQVYDAAASAVGNQGMVRHLIAFVTSTVSKVRARAKTKEGDKSDKRAGGGPVTQERMRDATVATEILQQLAKHCPLVSVDASVCVLNHRK